MSVPDILIAIGVVLWYLVIFMFFMGCCDDSHRKPCQVIISICLLGVRVWYWEEEKLSLGVVDGTVEVFTLLRSYF